MSSVESLFKSFIVLIVCLISSVIITEFILQSGEMMRTEYIKTGVADSPPEWGGQDNSDFALSLGYFLTYVLDFYAIGQFIWVAVRRQRYDVQGQPIEEGGI